MGLTPGPGTPAVPSSGPRDPKRDRRSSLPSPPGKTGVGTEHWRAYEREVTRKGNKKKSRESKRAEAHTGAARRTARKQRIKKGKKQAKEKEEVISLVHLR